MRRWRSGYQLDMSKKVFVGPVDEIRHREAKGNSGEEEETQEGNEVLSEAAPEIDPLAADPELSEEILAVPVGPIDPGQAQGNQREEEQAERDREVLSKMAVKGNFVSHCIIQVYGKKTYAIPEIHASLNAPSTAAPTLRISQLVSQLSP